MTSKIETVTIKNIAEKLKLSPTTVSYVLSGQAEKRQVAPQTALRVKKMAQKMGYVPNLWARSLRSRQSKVISVIVGDLSQAWTDKVTRGIAQALQKKDYTFFLAVDWRDTKLLDREITAILQRNDAGVICHPHISAQKEYLRLTERKIPFVFVSDVPEDLHNSQGINAVLWDDEPAVTAAIRHLIEIGRKNVSFVGFRHGLLSDSRRYIAYEDTLKKANIPLNNEWILWSKGIPYLLDEIQQLFSSPTPPDAIFTLNDALAIEILAVLDKIKKSVPEDVALVGVGDLPMASMDRISLTTVREPLEEMGKTSAEMILNLIEEPTTRPVVKYVECNELKIRNTTTR